MLIHLKMSSNNWKKNKVRVVWVKRVYISTDKVCHLSSLWLWASDHIYCGSDDKYIRCAVWLCMKQCGWNGKRGGLCKYYACSLLFVCSVWHGNSFSTLLSKSLFVDGERMVIYWDGINKLKREEERGEWVRYWYMGW